MALERLGDGEDHLRVGEHAQLHHRDPEVLEAGVDLLAQEGGRGDVDARHAPGVLGGEGRQRGEAVDAMRGEWS